MKGVCKEGTFVAVMGDRGRAALPEPRPGKNQASARAGAHGWNDQDKVLGRRRRNSLPGREALVIVSYPVYSYFLPITLRVDEFRLIFPVAERANA